MMLTIKSGILSLDLLQVMLNKLDYLKVKVSILSIKITGNLKRSVTLCDILEECFVEIMRFKNVETN